MGGPGGDRHYAAHIVDLPKDDVKSNTLVRKARSTNLLHLLTNKHHQLHHTPVLVKSPENRVADVTVTGTQVVAVAPNTYSVIQADDLTPQFRYILLNNPQVVEAVDTPVLVKTGVKPAITPGYVAANHGAIHTAHLPKGPSGEGMFAVTTSTYHRETNRYKHS